MNRNTHVWRRGCMLLVALAILFGLPSVYAARPSAGEAKMAPVVEAEVGIAAHIKRIQTFVNKQEAMARKAGQHFTKMSEQEMARKLTRVNSPMIVSQGWSGSTTPGGSISYTVGIYNPDPVSHSSLYAHVFIGPANMVPDTGKALAAVDARFPRLTEPDFFGLSLGPGASASLSFSVAVPAGMELSNYLGNTFLFKASYHDVGTYLDRSVFPFEVN